MENQTWGGETLLYSQSLDISYTDLYPGLTQLGPLAELLPGVDVRVLGPLEGLLQLVQLVGGEGGAGPSLLPLQGDPGLGLGVGTLLGTLGFD